MSGQGTDEPEDPDLTEFDWFGGRPVPWIWTEEGAAWREKQSDLDIEAGRMTSGEVLGAEAERLLEAAGTGRLDDPEWAWLFEEDGLDSR